MSLGALNVKASDIQVEFAKTKKSASYVQRKSIIIEIVTVRKTEQYKKKCANCKKSGRLHNPNVMDRKCRMYTLWTLILRQL